MERHKKEKIKRLSLKYLLFFGIIIVFIVFFAFKGFERFNTENQSDSTNANSTIVHSGLEEMNLGNGLILEHIERYAGMFVEDGSDETVTDVFALTITNKNDRWLEYTEIILAGEKDTYTFTLSALPPGATARVLEKERKTMPKDTTALSPELKYTAFYTEAPTTYPEIFELNSTTQQITVKNISDSDIDGDIYIYYKVKQDDIYIGGIAYRVKAGYGLKAGEEVQCYAGHYNPDSAEILFVTYVE